MCHDKIIGLYERHALDYDRDRARTLQEKAWLDRFVSGIPRGGVVLDLGCAMGEPIAGYLLSRGLKIVGIDSSPTLLRLARERFPESEWILADMRTVNLGRRFDGILAWDSFFHLRGEDQRAMFPRFASHAAPGAPLLFTSGSENGESIGSYCGEALYHASLDTAEYEELLAMNGFSVLAHVVEDPECGGHTIWLTRYEGNPV